MQYGLTLSLTGINGDVRQLVEFARLAEDAGWDGVFLEDYIVYHSEGNSTPLYDPWLALAAIAVRTERIRLGITVTPLARRRPWKVARESITLDHLSNGRLILGFGLGDAHDSSFRSFGEESEPKIRAEMLDEGLDVLTGLLSGQTFSYHGKHYQVEEVRFLPRPVQMPRIPIWLGGFWPRKGPVQRAARWDGFCAAKVDENGQFVLVTPTDVQALQATIASLRTTSEPFTLITGGQTPGDDPAQARALLAPFAEAGLDWWMEFTDGEGAPLRTRIEQGPPRL